MMRMRHSVLGRRIAAGSWVHAYVVNLLPVIAATGSLYYVLAPPMGVPFSPSAVMHSAAWQEDEEDEVAQQVMSDACNEVVPYLNHPQKDVLVTVVAGGLSGAAAKTAVAPLARLTILYQVNALQPPGAKAPNLLAAMKQVVRQEGLLSLWKGNLATIIHRVPYSAVNFTTFEMAKSYLEPHVQNDVLRRLVAGGMSGLVACTVAYPLDLVRTRLSAQRTMLPHTTRWTGELGQLFGVTPDLRRPTPLGHNVPQEAKPPKNYRGIMHAFRCIIREDGLRGLYRGLTATLVQVTPTLAINFCLYDSFRALYVSHVSNSQPPATALAVASPCQPPASTASIRQWHVHRQLTSELAQNQQGSRQEQVLQPRDGELQGARTGEGPTAGAAGKKQGTHVDLTGSLVCAAGAGFVTSTVTFPLDVVRKRMQTQRKGPRLTYMAACSQIIRHGGLKGFYAGIIPEYCKVLPGMAIAFAIYEGIKNAAGVKHNA